MAQRRHHYEHAFEAYLRARRIPYVAVDEARKALLPESHQLKLVTAGPDPAQPVRTAALKSFDFVIYGQGSNVLVEIKGRRVARRAGKSGGSAVGRLETWVTQDDVESLQAWQQLFGPAFFAAFVFIYWCDEQPPDGLFQEIFEHRERWYAMRAVRLDEYIRGMRTRSPRWRTVHIPAVVFERISQPFAPAALDAGLSIELPALDPLVGGIAGGGGLDGAGDRPPTGGGGSLLHARRAVTSP